MQQIKYDMTKDFDSFYKYYGFLERANYHNDYISKRDACDMYEHIQKLYISLPIVNIDINIINKQEHEFALCVQWLSDALGRGQVILHE